MEIDLLFPQVVYRATLRDAEQFNQLTVNKITEVEKNVPSGGENWISDVYNTCGTYEVHSDAYFDSLTKLITKHVNWFARELTIPSDIEFKPKESWANVYYKHGYQEFHYHATHTFSAVYYAKVTKNTKIIFENPFTDMNPLPTRSTEYNAATKTYYPNAGELFIFRSHLKHAIPPHLDDDNRITLAFNF